MQNELVSVLVFKAGTKINLPVISLIFNFAALVNLFLASSVSGIIALDMVCSYQLSILIIGYLCVYCQFLTKGAKNDN